MSRFAASLKIEPNTRGIDWIIPDVHGCDLTLGKMLKDLELQKEDRLFFLGDLVNKGPRSFQVMDRLMRMESEGFEIIKVMGNHDLIWLDMLKGKISVNHTKIVDQGDLKWEKAKNDAYIDFLERSYYFIEIGKYLLVHAGFNFQAPKPFSDYESMTQIREFEPEEHILHGRTVIHGHIAHPMDQIESAIRLRLQKVPLDNGCVYFRTREGMGNLLALNLATFEVISQSNLDV